MKVWMKRVALQITYAEKEIKKIDDDLGIRESNDKLQFGSFLYFHKDKDARDCPYWIADIEHELLSEIRSVITEKINSECNGIQSGTMPPSTITTSGSSSCANSTAFFLVMVSPMVTTCDPDRRRATSSHTKSISACL